MDFSSLLSQEINKKRKANDRGRISKKGKPSVPPKESVPDEEKQLATLEGEQKQTQDKDGQTTHQDEESELVNSISDEQLREKLLEFNETDTDSDKLTLVKKLQILTRNQNRLNKYRDQIQLESRLHEAPEKKMITMESILNTHKFQDELYVQLRVYIKDLIKEWEEEESKKPEQEALLHETKVDLVKVLYKLRVHKLTPDMLTSLTTIMYYIQNSEYRKANESYMKLSIGNVAWPIGVRDVGIHARSADLKIAKANANIMIDDKTRRWITSIKRLLTFKERQWDKSHIA
ncbi:uncharacterized protein CANTADRAFT_25581 [Suhomyces tanzawaensis NRRL Y-17324]|uniref:Pre-mRNA-splicing factor 18 n=1 Tax=Suhomyces tanzawaensis NRRL Y-17324 TaxID=984487 RepID=A0A1E4SJJ0_9ASCO|nr:uncharacterized protein CANTADRAFT_25581 [Suhomyces tanzawaensis NRRL Y-17324]ODV79676.1 hypothetical protein CANTADRAFT_25581 [Suhomyces tanzawaensis NRRL Y-17324]